jgi:Ca2+-dependent lipid-binding protein
MVGLTEGVNLPKADDTGFSNPYVVFTCKGKTRTSSVKLQTLNLEWNGKSAAAVERQVAGQSIKVANSKCCFFVRL